MRVDMNKSLINVDEQIFELVNSSQNLAGVEFNSTNVSVINWGRPNPNRELIDSIDNDTILEFLRCPETKVYITHSENVGEASKMIAHNFISNETIEINNIGDHFIAMNRVLFLALEKRKELKTNPDAKILSHELILSINRQLLKRRYENGEVGIGLYRSVDLIGRPCNPIIATMDHGRLIPIKEWQPEPGGLVEIKNHNGRFDKIPRNQTLIDLGFENDNKFPRTMVLIDELLNWVNSDEFRQTDPILRAAMFYTRFMHIHPFMDGNSRTDRMLLNYLLIISGKKPSNVANESYESFLAALTESIVNKNYEPFVALIKKHQVSHSRDLYISVMNVNKLMGRNNNLQAQQIQ